MAEHRARLKKEDDRKEPNFPERVLMVASTAFTIAILAYAAWLAVTTPPGAHPHAEIVAMETLPSGDVRVHVELVNEGSVGLVMAEVSVDCAEPPPSITFENVPVHDERSGTLVCPPGTTSATASVDSYVEA